MSDCDVLSYLYRIQFIMFFFFLCDFPYDDYDPVFYFFLLFQSLIMYMYILCAFILLIFTILVYVDTCWKWWRAYGVNTIKK